MSSAADAALGPPASLRYRRRLGPRRAITDLWRSRELVWTLAERDIRARYKQAVLGFAWALVTPLALMVVFTVVFQAVGHIDTGAVPYPLFSYIGLLPWTFFATTLSLGGLNLVTNAPLLNKVQCPREVFPLASECVAGTDAVIAVGALGVLFLWFGFAPKITSLWVPAILVPLLAFTTGITVLTSAIMVYMRDLRHVIPIVLQIGLFATPVAYPMDQIPAKYQVLYVTLNPLAAVINGLRRTVLYGLDPDWRLMVPATISSLVVLIGGYVLFKKLETGIADVA